MNKNQTSLIILRESKKLFARYGFNKTSTSMIAEAVGIKKPSLYYFFKNKEEIYLSILEEIIYDVIHLFEKGHDTRASLENVLEELFKVSKKNGPVIFSTDTLNEANMQKISQLSQELLDAMKKYLLEYRLNIDIDASLVIILDTSQMYAQRIAHSQTKITPKYYSQILTRLLTT